MKIGLWVQDSSGKEFLITKDLMGYPHLVDFTQKALFFEGSNELLDLSLEEGKRIYQEVTGKVYPFGHATTRQVLWDLVEAGIKLLP
ncbi:MAG: hypothetical protein ACYDBV_02090 [Nitrospiria bacterium]